MRAWVVASRKALNGLLHSFMQKMCEGDRELESGHGSWPCHGVKERPGLGHVTQPDRSEHQFNPMSSSHVPVLYSLQELQPLYFHPFRSGDAPSSESSEGEFDRCQALVFHAPDSASVLDAI
jgi:hypothetical protein